MTEEWPALRLLEHLMFKILSSGRRRVGADAIAIVGNYVFAGAERIWSPEGLSDI
jgi:hypothetical protein